MGKSHLILMCFLVGVTLMDTSALNSVQDEQPIKYNHKLHIEEALSECTDCHVQAEKSTRASIPNIQICGDCHSDLEVENSEQRKVAEYVQNGTQIPWHQVHLVPDHVYFSHRRHVSLGQIECSECHGDVSQMETPFVKPFQQIAMAWCIDCHKQRQVTSECYACHR